MPTHHDIQKFIEANNALIFCPILNETNQKIVCSSCEFFSTKHQTCQHQKNTA